MEHIHKRLYADSCCQTSVWSLGSQEQPWTDFDNEYIRIKYEVVAAANRAVPKTTQRTTVVQFTEYTVVCLVEVTLTTGNWEAKLTIQDRTCG